MSRLDPNYKIVINFKRIKNVYLRIDSNSNIVVSAPFNTSEKIIYDFINRKLNWIEKHKKIIENRSVFNTEVNFNNHEKLPFRGKMYELQIENHNRNFIEFKNNKLILYTNKIDDTNYKRVMFETWYFNQAKNLFKELLLKWSAITDLHPGKIKIKKMKSRWGSCNFKNKNINLNSELIKYNQDFIEYVILHELAHLKYPNHGKHFHSFLFKYMPDYKKRKLLSKKTEII